MLWLDVIDILYLILGFAFGIIMCTLIHKDDWMDECKDCEYRKFIEEVLDRAGE